MPRALVLLPPRFCEYELGNALGVLAAGGCGIDTAALTREPVQGEAGLRAMPDLALAQLDPSRYQAVVVPGFADLAPVLHHRRFDLALQQVGGREEVVVAAISAGTFLLARSGVAAGRAMTTPWPRSDRETLGVFDEACLRDAPWVRDGRFVTACGWAHLELAFALGEALVLRFSPGQFSLAHRKA